jgi:hypothetical protein
LNAKDAAKKCAMRHGYIEVLSGVADQKRSGNGTQIYYRMPLFKDEHFTFNVPGTQSPLAHLLTQKLERYALKEIRPLIEMGRTRGIAFTLTEKEGKSILHITPMAHCTVKKPELDSLRDLARDNMALFIEALGGEKASPKATESTPIAGAAAPDPLKGKKLQDITLMLLPQMPTPFTLDDFIDRLRAAGFTELVTQRPRLQGAIQYAIDKKQVTRDGRARYKVVEEYRHRRANGEAPKEPEVIVTPPPVAESPTQQPEINLALQIPPQTVIEVPPPAQPAPVFNAQTLVATVLDLASQAAAGNDDDDMAQLAAGLKEASELCVSNVLNAVSALTDKVQSVVDRLSKQANARQALIRSLTLRPDTDNERLNRN